MWNADLIVASKAQQEGLSRRGLRLTPAELRVLCLLPTHLTLDAIAGQLGRRRSTVKAHVEHIYKKLGASNRGEAVARACESGLLVAPDGSTELVQQAIVLGAAADGVAAAKSEGSVSWPPRQTSASAS